MTRGWVTAPHRPGSNQWHPQVERLCTTVALTGAAGWEAADDWAALVAAIVLVANGVRLRPAVNALMDRMPDPAVVERIGAAGSVPGVLATEKLRVRTFGTGYFVDLHVQADPGMSLRDAHAPSGRVKAAIKATVPAVFDTSIHIEPFESANPSPAGGANEAPTAEVASAVPGAPVV